MGAKVLRTFVLGSESSREQKFQGANSPPGAKVLMSESSCYLCEYSVHETDANCGYKIVSNSEKLCHVSFNV